VQLAVQQRFNGSDGRHSLNNVPGLRNLVRNLVRVEPARHGHDLRFRRLHDARDLLNVEVLAIARRSAKANELQSSKTLQHPQRRGSHVGSDTASAISLIVSILRG